MKIFFFPNRNQASKSFKMNGVGRTEGSLAASSLYPLKDSAVFKGGCFNSTISVGFSVETGAINQGWSWLGVGSASVGICSPRSVDPRPTPQNYSEVGEQRRNGAPYDKILRSCFG